jgi:hypothetical protein
MAKIHTKIKRKHVGPTHLGCARPETRNRKKRPKTFSSEDIAKKWADSHGIKKYELKNLRLGTKDKKIRVVAL